MRSGVQPPLLVEYRRIEVDGGFVLAVDVRRSPLGLFMVEAYKSYSYFRRSGRSTVPMTAREVRDAHALAAGAREQRSDDWSARHLPLRPGAGTWLVISALPELLDGDVLDMSHVQPADLHPPEEIWSRLADWNIGGMTGAFRSLTRWAQGFHGSDGRADGWGREIRIYRDGAAALAFDLDATEAVRLSTPRIYRLANVGLSYLAWLWQSIGLRSDVEVVLDVVGHRGRYFTAADPAVGHLRIEGPRGVPTPEVTHRELVVPRSLQQARVRHGLVMQFADRLHQALGEPRVEAPFRRGLLYGRDGLPLEASLGHDSIRSETTWGGGGFMARIHDRGEVVGRQGNVVGWHLDGCVVDLSGDTVALVELAPGAGCPDDFGAARMPEQVDGTATQFLDTPVAYVARHEVPSPTGQWSTIALADLVEMEGLDPFGAGS